METPSVDRWGGYNTNSDGVAQSLASRGESVAQIGGYFTDTVTQPTLPDVATPTPPAVVTPGLDIEPQKTKWRSPAFLTLDVPDGRRTDVTKHTDVRNPVKERSDVKPREDLKKKMGCKARPSNNKPREDKPRGGGGGGAPLPLERKKFVPWC